MSPQRVPPGATRLPIFANALAWLLRRNARLDALV